MPEFWWIFVVVGVFLAMLALMWRPMRAASRQARFAEMRRNFHRQRERLEVKFIQLASAKAKVNSPHWADCEFGDDVTYVRNRNTGELSAFVSLTVAMDDLDNPSVGVGDLVGNLRAGTAVFRFDRDHWETDGRAILNLNPTEAIRFYRNDLEIVEHELTHKV